MRKISNENHIAKVVQKLYSDAQEIDWEHLTHAEHTEWYTRWLADQSVGGVLTTWMSPEEARVWLKDGPMKEYARALAGEGTFAKYIEDHPRGPARIVEKALGNGWTVVWTTVRVKPLQCRATNGQQTVKVFWGPAKDFKHLLWAALKLVDERAYLVVWDTVSNPLQTQARDKISAIGRRCSLDVRFIRLN